MQESRHTRAVRDFVERLGVAGDARGPRHRGDLFSRVPAALLAIRSVASDETLADERVARLLARLGVASGPRGFLSLRDALGRGLPGALALWSVARDDGIDLRGKLRAFIEGPLMQTPMRPSRKALLLTVLYAAARRLPAA